MKVKVIAKGYYNHKRRYVGDILDVKENEFSEQWMTKVKAGAPVEPVAEAAVVYDEDDEVI